MFLSTPASLVKICVLIFGNLQSPVSSLLRESCEFCARVGSVGGIAQGLSHLIMVSNAHTTKYATTLGSFMIRQGVSTLWWRFFLSKRDMSSSSARYDLSPFTHPCRDALLLELQLGTSH